MYVRTYVCMYVCMFEYIHAYSTNEILYSIQHIYIYTYLYYIIFVVHILHDTDYNVYSLCTEHCLLYAICCM